MPFDVPQSLAGPEQPGPIAASLERRTPGETDLRVFTTEVLPAGRHRLVPGRSRLRLVYGRGRPVLRAVAVLAVGALLAGCSASGDTARGGGGVPVSAEGTGAVDLRGVCPKTVVVQTSWFSQVEHFAAYQLLGAGYAVDAGRKRVTGPLVSGGRDTGVDIEIRAGGPAIGFQQVSAQMYADRTITLGMLAMDEAIQNAKDQPTTAVMAPYDVDPLVLMWDPARHPDFNTIADIGQTDTRVLYFQGESTYMDHLTGTGTLKRSQVDGSYEGTPDRLAASRGDLVVQGFATSEPWKWANEIPQWGRPLNYQLVSDAGYPGYRNMLSIRTGDRAELDGCLRRLVPMFQRATVEFMADPKPVTTTVLSIIRDTRQAYTDSPARSAYAVKAMRDLGLVTNGRDTTVGDFDLAPAGRVGRLLNIVRPIFAAQRKPVPNGLTGIDVATNDYIDPSIGLPASTPTSKPTGKPAGK